MKRKYFVKSILFLLLTAMVLLSVNAYGDDADAENKSDFPALGTGAFEEPVGSGPVATPEPDGMVSPEETVEAGDVASPEPDFGMEGDPILPEDNGIRGDLFPFDPYNCVPLVTPDPEWDALFENAVIYTGKLQSESLLDDAVLKLTDDGRCELTVLIDYYIDEYGYYFDFYTGVPHIWADKAKLYVQSKGTYVIAENGVFSAVFDRSAAYAEFSSDADDTYKQNTYTYITSTFGSLPISFYAALFSGKTVELRRCNMVYDIFLEAVLDSADGVFTPINFARNDGREMPRAAISYVYRNGRKVREMHAIYDRHLVDFDDYETYADWPFNHFYELEFRSDGTKWLSRDRDGAGRILNECGFSKDGICTSIVRYEKDGTVEHASGMYYPDGGRIEDSEDALGTRMRKVYDPYGSLYFTQELRYADFEEWLTERFPAVSSIVTEERFEQGHSVGSYSDLYDENDVRIGLVEYSAEQNVERWVVFEYHENGVLALIVSYTADGKVIESQKNDEFGRTLEARYPIGENGIDGYTIIRYGAAENGGGLAVDYDADGNRLREYIW